MWALKIVPIQSISLSNTKFPSRIRYNSEKTPIMMFSIKLYIQNSKIINFNFSIYIAQWRNSSKGLIHTCEGKINLRLPCIDPIKEGVDCLLCSDLADDDVAQVEHAHRKRARPIWLNTRLARLKDIYCYR